MSAFRVDPSHVQAVGRTLNDVGQQIGSSGQRLRVAGEGVQAPGFTLVQGLRHCANEWSQHIREAGEKISQAGDLLYKVADNYRNSDDSVASGFGGVS